MKAITSSYSRAVIWVSTPHAESIALMLLRIALAGIFWRSARTKVIDGTWIMLSDTASELFKTEYSSVPLPPSVASHLALGAETIFPILLVLGLFTRLSALGLLGMTMIIQIFVYPDAWWQVHIIWAAMALILIVRGGGMLSLDHLLMRKK
jgi:putative oxidoreductase